MTIDGKFEILNKRFGSVRYDRKVLRKPAHHIAKPLTTINIMIDPKQIVKNYLDIFFGEKFNPEILRPLITNDFCFKGPLMSATNSQEFISKLKALGEEIDMNAEIHKIIIEKNTVVAQYDFLLSNNTRIPACEWYEVREDKISKMLLFCDPKSFFN